MPIPDIANFNSLPIQVLVLTIGNTISGIGRIASGGMPSTASKEHTNLYFQDPPSVESQNRMYDGS
jgi:hypothetical protein